MSQTEIGMAIEPVRLPPVAAAKAMASVVNWMDRLKRGIMPPQLQIVEMIDALKIAHALNVAAQLRIADRVAEGERACDDLAREVGADSGALYRLLRALASKGVFEETRPGIFSLTPSANCLRSDVDGSLRAWVGLLEHNWKMWGQLEYSVRTGRSAFEKVFGAPPHDYHAQHPELAAEFDEAMAGFSRFAAAAVATCYDFADANVVCDVGGGDGTLLAGILKAYPGLSGILFEGPWVTARARARLEKNGLAGRCGVVDGNFMDEVAPGADVYMAKNVLHDWDDDNAVRLLSNIRRVMPVHGRLLIIEFLVPDGNGASPAKMLDLTMLVSTGGRERTEVEYRGLLSRAGFDFQRVVRTPLPHSIVEAKPGQFRNHSTDKER